MKKKASVKKAVKGPKILPPDIFDAMMKTLRAGYSLIQNSRFINDPAHEVTVLLIQDVEFKQHGNLLIVQPDRKYRERHTERD